MESYVFAIHSLIHIPQLLIDSCYLGRPSLYLALYRRGAEEVDESPAAQVRRGSVARSLCTTPTAPSPELRRSGDRARWIDEKQLRQVQLLAPGEHRLPAEDEPNPLHSERGSPGA